MRIARVLVALDGSRGAEVAVPMALDLVKENLDAKVVLVRAIDPARPTDEPAGRTRLAAVNEAVEYLGEVATRMHREGMRPIVRSVWCADPRHAISELARTMQPDLIVMASRHRNASGRLVPGPIVDAVRERTGIPVVLVAGDTPVDAPATRTTTGGGGVGARVSGGAR